MPGHLGPRNIVCRDIDGRVSVSKVCAKEPGCCGANGRASVRKQGGDPRGEQTIVLVVMIAWSRRRSDTRESPRGTCDASDGRGDIVKCVLVAG